MTVQGGVDLYNFFASNQLAGLTYGYHREQFSRLVEYLALISISMWALVAFTTVMRWSARLMYRRKHEKEYE